MRPATAAVVVAAALATVRTAAAQARWQTVDDPAVGVRLSVPDPAQCRWRRDRGVAGMACDYGDLRVVAVAWPRELTLAELRAAAHAYAEVRAEHWRRRGEARDQRGFRHAERWRAAQGERVVEGVLGLSRRRAGSHLVFISGSAPAFRRHARQIEGCLADMQLH